MSFIQQWRRHYLIVFVFLAALLLRLYTISDASIVFWYDQARDFALVQQIIDGDLKIQGPSASGTNDTIYHGVFYYYYILPWVWLGGGEPVLVNVALAILGALAIPLVYGLSYWLWRRRALSTLFAVLLAVSFLNTQLATWLSNPHTLTLSVPLFYYFFHRLFFSERAPRPWRCFVGLGLSLGLSVQAGIFEVYLIMPIVLAYLLRAWQTKRVFYWSLAQMIWFSAAAVLSVSSMLLTQYLLISRGILDLHNLPLGGQGGELSWGLLEHIGKMYLQQFQLMLSPAWPQLSYLFLPVLLLAWWRLRSQQRWSALLLLTAPIWLLAVQQRNSPHLFIGVELLVYLLLAFGLLQIWRSCRLGSLAVGLCVLVFVMSNLLGLERNKQAMRHHFYPVQNGTFLRQQLALLDHTYQLAAGAPFTLSSSTNPFSINVTWGYLYKTYGPSRYGYLPHFVGPDQIGLVGQDFLPRSEQPAALHFTILEPDTGLNEKMTEIFMGEQDSYSQLVEEVKFGSLLLQVRQAQ